MEETPEAAVKRILMAVIGAFAFLAASAAWSHPIINFIVPTHEFHVKYREFITLLQIEITVIALKEGMPEIRCDLFMSETKDGLWVRIRSAGELKGSRGDKKKVIWKGKAERVRSGASLKDIQKEAFRAAALVNDYMWDIAQNLPRLRQKRPVKI